MAFAEPVYSPVFRRQRPNRIIGLVFVAVVIAGIFMVHVQLSSVQPSHLRNMLPTHVFGSGSAPCSPYDQHGYLAYDKGNLHANRWVPYAGTPAARASANTTAVDACTQPAPALAAAFLRASWADKAPSLKPSGEMRFADADLGPDGQPWADVEWARNKTILFLGDSVSRITIKDFCEMAGEQFIELNWKHPWSPSEIPKDYRSRDALFEDDAEMGTMKADDDSPPLDPFGWHNVEPGSPNSHTGHYCYVPGLDFLFVHLHMFGLDQDDYWAFKHTYIPPYTFEERTHMVAKAYIDRIRATTARGRSAPELVYVNSGMWDVVRYSREDIEAGLEVDTPLSPERLSDYRSRVRDVVLDAAETFPHADVQWVATHYPIAPSNGWFYAEAKVKPKTRPDLKLIRLTELHEAAMSALRDMRDASKDQARVLAKVKLNRWGLAMRGMEKFQIDDLHPSFMPGGYLWADMALYDLRAAVA